MNGDRFVAASYFHPVDKRFQPDRLVSVFAGHRVAVGFKLNQSSLADFEWEYPTAFRWEFGQRDEMGLLSL